MSKQFPKLVRILAVTALLFGGCATVDEDADRVTGELWTTERVRHALYDSDDWRGFNRFMFGVDEFVMDYISCPLCHVYCSIVPRPLIRGIGNFVDNIEYPIRLFATLGRAEWGASWDETKRFCINTTVGIAGLFDPAQNTFGIFSTDASFSGTFADWGIAKGPPLVIPFIPRGNTRDVCGYIVDFAFDPKTYFSIFLPTGIGIGWPAVFWPNYAAKWTTPWESVIEELSDPYSTYLNAAAAKSYLDADLCIYRYVTDLVAGTAKTERPPVRAPFARPEGLRGRWRDIAGFEPRTPALDTLRCWTFAPKREEDFWWERHSIFNDDFIKDVDDRAVSVAADFPNVRYGFVPPAETAPTNAARRLVFIIPGINGTRNCAAALGLAELITESGAAAVLCDDPFHFEYMVSANHGMLPGNLPEDAQRFADFMRVVLADLKAEGLAVDPEVSVVGWSMGGLLTSHLAAIASREDLGVRFGPMLAINPPVSFDSVVTGVESFLEPTRAWSRNEAQRNFLNAAARLAVWNELGLEATPDISEQDARITSAMALGAVLPGLVKCATGTNMPVTIRQYFTEYVLEDYPGLDFDALAQASGLRSLEKDLTANARLSMIHTRDDFLLSDADRDYLDRVFGDRLTWFSCGAHCGMFHTPEFQDELLTRLGLKEGAR